METKEKKTNEISDKLMERSRQYQKLQSMYDAMRRKCITTSTFDGSEDGGTSNNALKNVQNFSLSLSSGEDFLRKTNKMQHHHHPSSRLSSPPEAACWANPEYKHSFSFVFTFHTFIPVSTVTRVCDSRGFSFKLVNLKYTKAQNKILMHLLNYSCFNVNVYSKGSYNTGFAKSLEDTDLV
ncbi:hypothetical protein KUTeg_022562 [Tegillarca granosa]|uniref:Uncharacterized protein n=1 Tax=Tegillarca granosa TaxID=220873 RepID=A0ABQ9E6J9_TEGGR|nr:hypothetical protein KUTeg_022562 [Tegillarca granosa]